MKTAGNTVSETDPRCLPVADLSAVLVAGLRHLLTGLLVFEPLQRAF